MCNLTLLDLNGFQTSKDLYDIVYPRIELHSKSWTWFELLNLFLNYNQNELWWSTFSLHLILHLKRKLLARMSHYKILLLLILLGPYHQSMNFQFDMGNRAFVYCINCKCIYPAQNHIVFQDPSLYHLSIPKEISSYLYVSQSRQRRENHPTLKPFSIRWAWSQQVGFQRIYRP